MQRSLLLACLLVFLVAVGRAADTPQPLADAVKEFNRLAVKDAIGRLQPPLTEAEVVAAIGGWIREQTPVTDDTYQTFQGIAKSRQLPSGADLRFTTRWTRYKGYDFDVWWVDLSIITGEKSGYTFRIRDQKIGSQPTAGIVSRVRE